MCPQCIPKQKRCTITCRILTICLFVCTMLLNAGYVFAQEAEVFVYDSHGRRDPFVPLVGLRHITGITSMEITSIDDVDFQGIASDAKGRKIIIINGEMLAIGGKLDSLTVKYIGKDDALVEIRGEEYNLNFYEKGE